MEDWYASTSLDTIAWDNYRAWFLTVKHVPYKADKVAIFNKIFDALEAASKPAESDVKNIIEAFIERDYATKIADHTLRIAEGEDLPLEEVGDLLTHWEKESGKIDELESKIVEGDFEELIASTLLGTGFDWRLPDLNKSVGPLRKGDFIIIGATPETGKTTALASEASFMAEQMKDDEVVLWINNEEGSDKVRLRCIQAALGWTNAKMLADPKLTYQTYLDLMGGVDRLKIVRAEEMDVHMIDAMFKKYNPGLIIMDQLWKVPGFTREAGANEVMRQALLFNKGREWAKKYCPLITVHQADGSAVGQKYLDMSQLYMSRIAIQGEADAIIMIGKSNDPADADNARYLHIPKNKLSGGPLSEASYRHGKFELLIEPEIARYRSFL
jgi:replicative DNA helicase